VSDADTGFGEALNMDRDPFIPWKDGPWTGRLSPGKDQVNPKRWRPSGQNKSLDHAGDGGKSPRGGRGAAPPTQIPHHGAGLEARVMKASMARIARAKALR